MGPVVRERTVARPPQRSCDPCRQTEEKQCLIDNVRTQVKPDAATRSGALTPAFAHLRAVTIDMRFKVHHPADRTCLDSPPYTQEVAIPAPVVEYGQQPPVVVRGRAKSTGIGQARGEGLLNNHILAGLQCSLGPPRMAVVGRGY